jgi:DNA-binding transcriptional regulator GbsR (MarR family)
MGQQEVYDFLKANAGSWYTSREIAEALDISIGSVTMSLKKLRKTNIITFQNTGMRNTFKYSISKRAVKATRAINSLIAAFATSTFVGMLISAVI